MHTVQNYKLSKLMWQTEPYSNATDNFKVQKLAQKEFAKMVHRRCMLRMQSFHFFLAQNSDNPKLNVH